MSGDPLGNVPTVLSGAGFTVAPVPGSACAFPEGAPTVRVFGQWRDPSGCPARGRLTFTGPPVVTWGALTFTCRTEVALDSAGYFEVDLLATNAPGLNPNDWTYQVGQMIEGCGPCRPYAISLPLGSGPINLNTVAPVGPRPGNYVPVPGPPGPEGPAGPPGRDGSVTQPRRLTIYYGIPNGANLRYDNTYAAGLFSRYDYIVFGTGLADPENVNYPTTVEIIAGIKARNPAARVFGYVDIGVTPPPSPAPTTADIHTGIDQWKTAGATDVFFDRAGYDYGVTRVRQNDAADYAHAAGLGTCMNTWRPGDAMSSDVDPVGNPDGLPPHIDQRDTYLLESWVVNTDSYSTTDGYAGMYSTKTRADLARQYRDQTGVRLLAVSTVDYSAHTEEEIETFERMTECLGIIFGIDGYGTNATNYAADARNLNVQRPADYARDYPLGGIVNSTPYVINGAWTQAERSEVPVNVTYDTATHTYTYSLGSTW